MKVKIFKLKPSLKCTTTFQSSDICVYMFSTAIGYALIFVQSFKTAQYYNNHTADLLESH